MMTLQYSQKFAMAITRNLSGFLPSPLPFKSGNRKTWRTLRVSDRASWSFKYWTQFQILLFLVCLASSDAKIQLKTMILVCDTSRKQIIALFLHQLSFSSSFFFFFFLYCTYSFMGSFYPQLSAQPFQADWRGRTALTYPPAPEQGVPNHIEKRLLFHEVNQTHGRLGESAWCAALRSSRGSALGGVQPNSSSWCLHVSLSLSWKVCRGVIQMCSSFSPPQVLCETGSKEPVVTTPC